MSEGARETGRDADEADALLAAARGPVPPPDATVAYGDDPEQRVDLYGVEAPGAPRAVLLHGGFWRQAYDRGYLVPFAAALVARGVAVALPEYRRVGGGGGWPATFDDVRAGLAALPGNGPLILVGHSAGAHLALLAAVRHPDRVTATVGVGALADLRRAAALGLGAGAVAAFLAQGAADPLDGPRPPAPVLLAHGADDAQVPPEVARGYAERHGARLALLPGTGHYAPFIPASPAGTWLLAEIVEAVRRA
ncbi:alpha/beta hydrolase [Streptomyces sp. PT12]|uniref:alpha/beta hydrolase n=1 Tax=Streptomyces sp. PT12 TaxID=1510197 RepID=UPI00215CEC84|nr:alpha/beta hydrolase [Streptomyces sp. PT12]